MGVEPTSPAWKAGVIAVIRRSQIYAVALHDNNQKDPSSCTSSCLTVRTIDDGDLTP